MNNAAITQPITDSDVTAVVDALRNPSGGDAAKLGMLKMLVTIASQTQALGIKSSDVFNSLAAGSTSFADTALYEALALETSLTTSWGALILQGAGIIQLISWAKSAPAWIAATVSNLETIIVDVATANLSGAGTALLNIFGIGTPIAKDSTAVSQMFSIMATSSAPALAAVLSYLNSTKATTSGTGGQGNTAASASGSSSGSVSGSAATSGSASGSKDSANFGIRSRRSIVRNR